MSETALIDLFAGAGGLTEGFLRNDYEFVSHVEMDLNAIRTLETRCLYHYLKRDGNSDDYSAYLMNEISRDELFEEHPEFNRDLYMNLELTEGNKNCVIEHIKSKVEVLGFESVEGIIGGPHARPTPTLEGRVRIWRMTGEIISTSSTSHS